MLPTRGEISYFVNVSINTLFPSWMLQTPWDHVLHFSVSFLGVIAIFFVMKFMGIDPKKSLIASVCTVLALGLFKEFYVDLYIGNSPFWDYVVDIAANFAGIALAVFLITRMYSKNTPV